ncbi:TPA: hypothetical protein L3934_006039 [Pseudomonas aeruginosa]|uniref:hypothetical protein n=1 Tax=Pseudomonas aeruginosa TaxID=287 RepID=UPI00136940ED|nr:hypothetical protein [Pseudomonas aeruginosa]MXU53626.1 hypothetical protein [Pseudomonas aeruginosa]HBN9848015.1 hypothetical protein [Pseudomonas aeruginosa]
MSFKGGVTIVLNDREATKMTEEVLKEQLTRLGLTCELSSKHLLSRYIKDVRRDLADGVVGSYFIGSWDHGAYDFLHSSSGNWEQRDDTPESQKLRYICKYEHYEWLRKNSPSFTGGEPHSIVRKKNYDTVQAVKKAFVDIGNQMSESISGGLRKDVVESKLTNTIGILSDDAADYDSGYRDDVMLIAMDYDSSSHIAGGVGFIGVRWRVYINNYKGKTKNHSTEIDVKTWGVVYTDSSTLFCDYDAVRAAFG